MHSELIQSITSAEVEADKMINDAKILADSTLKKELEKIEKDKKKFVQDEQTLFRAKLEEAKLNLEKKYNEFLSSEIETNIVDSNLKKRAVELMLKEVLEV